MQAAQECAGRDLLGDVGDAGVRRLRRRHVVERETDAGDDLRDEDEQQSRTEDVGQARAAGNRLVERLLHQLVESGASVQPVEDALRKAPAPSGDGSGYCFLLVHGFTPHRG